MLHFIGDDAVFYLCLLRMEAREKAEVREKSTFHYIREVKITEVGKQERHSSHFGHSKPFLRGLEVKLVAGFSILMEKE